MSILDKISQFGTYHAAILDEIGNLKDLNYYDSNTQIGFSKSPLTKKQKKSKAKAKQAKKARKKNRK